MSKKQYSDEEVVKAFKVFIKKVVHNAAIDYARKVKNGKFREVLFCELDEEEVSLSNYYRDGTFFVERQELEIDNIGFNATKRIKNIILTLREKDQVILALSSEGKNNKEIADILGVKEKTISNRMSLIKKYVKERLKQ